MAAGARDAGVLPENLHVFATSASRDAAKGAVFVSMVQAETGIAPQIISGEEEAVLSFLGASAVVESDEPRGVIDIGGGSTEIVIGEGAGISLALSCQMGAVRLYRLLAIERKEDMPAVEYAAGEILREKWNTLDVPPVPKFWIGTGGTFTALAALSRGVPWTDRTYMHGTRLSAARIREIGEKLAGMTPEQRLSLEGLQPSRADIVVHGICILLAVMKHLGTEEITVSEYGNLDGYLRKHYFL